MSKGLDELFPHNDDKSQEPDKVESNDSEWENCPDCGRKFKKKGMPRHKGSRKCIVYKMYQEDKKEAEGARE